MRTPAGPPAAILSSGKPKAWGTQLQDPASTTVLGARQGKALPSPLQEPREELNQQHPNAESPAARPVPSSNMAA